MKRVSSYGSEGVRERRNGRAPGAAGAGGMLGRDAGANNREFKDVVFEDVVFDNNGFVTLLCIVL